MFLLISLQLLLVNAQVSLLQALVVTVRSRLPATRVLLEQDMNASSDISAALNIPEWKLLSYLVIRQGVLIDPYAVDSGEMAMFSVICTAAHRPMFLLLNAFIAMVTAFVGSQSASLSVYLQFPFVYLWVCGSVGLWVCGSVGLWVCGSVGLWVCGSVGLWVCGSVGL